MPVLIALAWLTMRGRLPGVPVNIRSPLFFTGVLCGSQLATALRVPKERDTEPDPDIPEFLRGGNRSPDPFSRARAALWFVVFLTLFIICYLVVVKIYI